MMKIITIGAGLALAAGLLSAGGLAGTAEASTAHRKAWTCTHQATVTWARRQKVTRERGGFFRVCVPPAPAPIAPTLTYTIGNAPGFTYPYSASAGGYETWANITVTDTAAIASPPVLTFKLPAGTDLGDNGFDTLLGVTVTQSGDTVTMTVACAPGQSPCSYYGLQNLQGDPDTSPPDLASLSEGFYYDTTATPPAPTISAVTLNGIPVSLAT